MLASVLFGASLWSITISSVGTSSPFRTDATVSSNNWGRLREQMMSVVAAFSGPDFHALALREFAASVGSSWDAKDRAFPNCTP